MSNWVSRLRISSSRPANAVANVWLISCSWASPPPLSRIDTDANVCSVVGYVLAADNGITEPFLSSPSRRFVGRRCQLDVHGTQQAGLSDLGGGVGGQMDVAVDAHGHQGMPVLHLDLGDVADVDVGDPDPGVLLDDHHVGQLRLDGVRIVAAARCAGQAQRVQAPPLTPRYRGQARDDERRGKHAPHGVPPGAAAAGGTIRPVSPWPGSVGTPGAWSYGSEPSAARPRTGSAGAGGPARAAAAGRGRSRSSL